MVVFSTLRSLLRLQLNASKNAVVSRSMSEHRTFPLTPSRWQWNKFKDLTHFYILIGIIPCTLGVAYANIFIGPATLSEIPEDYEPKYWEYYKNPVTRFIARYILTNPQQDYEKYLAHIFMEDERRRLRMLERDVKQKMAERQDYQAYYYRPVLAKYHRVTREAAQELENLRGD
ncbi:NADH dehydrogenase [ubiquinone] 1 beta subcomplex subunit 5, mitochondrial [Anoplophora glabripennis]|uniref:NADH dehydrogenase [ubiquinone] 1 beta subcomplex subunit 5, mitochondrial n=1 Tax=Anoplophora glabripennis TaxID=217634 RepID=UPI000873E9AA|nr:NADH dehydrogenase [ubiquinone] 1 beta subcomplex subunit 5, mitochondrial [Anoplophora glabripennis]